MKRILDEGPRHRGGGVVVPAERRQHEGRGAFGRVGEDVEQIVVGKVGHFAAAAVKLRFEVDGFGELPDRLLRFEVVEHAAEFRRELRSRAPFQAGEDGFEQRAADELLAGCRLHTG